MNSNLKINPLEFGKRLREGREKNNLTRPEACALLNISKSTLQAWENGGREPSVSNLIDIINNYAVTFEWLTTGNKALNRSLDLNTSSQVISQEWVSILNTISDEDKKIALKNIINKGFKTLLVDIDLSDFKRLTKRNHLSEEDLNKLSLDLQQALNKENDLKKRA